MLHSANSAKILTPKLPDWGALLAVVASTPTDSSVPGIGTHLSIAMALDGKRVCLLRSGRPDRSTDDICAVASLDQLIASHERMDMPQPSPAGILILHCDNRLQHFESLAPGHQLAIVGILQQLEVDFDCLLLEEPICDGMLPLIRSAPLLVLSLTTDGTSLTDSFRALQSLYNKPLNQQSYVLVDSASSLPQAHGAFKRLQRAASRYLGTEPHYLGHMPPQDAQRPLQQTFDSMAQQPVSAFDQSLQAIAERFRRALAKTGRCNVLSTHFHQRHQSNAAIGVVPVQLAPQQTTDTPTTARADRTDPGQNDGYRAATRFAMRLGAARQNGEENPAEGR